jgi:hypothetical protein
MGERRATGAPLFKAESEGGGPGGLGAKRKS